MTATYIRPRRDRGWWVTLLAAAGPLLARWGTTYPRWAPAVDGRPVSPGRPTLTAVGVGFAIAVAGRAMIQMILVEFELQVASAKVLLLMPFPIWGPALVAPAIAYHRRRPAADSVAA